MRAGANRSFALALLASLLLHALALAVLPSLRELAAQLPPVTVPLVARLAQPPTASSPPPAVQAAPRPAPHRPPVAPTAPPRAAETPALPPVAREAPREPVAQAAAAPAPQPAPAAPLQATSEPPAPAASGALARLEPLSAPAALPGPDPGALERYRLQLVTAAARFKRYPRSAIDNNWEGAVVVRMAIGADGRIAALGVARSSGHEVLDRQALEMFRTAKPFVQLPRELEGREFELELRAIYSLGKL